MTRTKKSLFKKHGLLLSSALASAILLVGFLWLTVIESRALEIPSKFLLISASPILISLIVGGYIKRFQGFGVTLETHLNKTLPSEYIDAVDFIESIGEEKGDLIKLAEMSEKAKASIVRLQFIIGRRGYYSPYAINAYINMLPELEFIEIIDGKRQFQFLIPISSVYTEYNDRIDQLIDAVENQKIRDVFPEAIDYSVSQNESIIAAYRTFVIHQSASHRDHELSVLPVVNSKNQMIGLAHRNRIESRIAQDVLANI